MVEIFSRRDGPRPEDARLKAFLDGNRSTITKIADHLTQGNYSASKAAAAAPAPQSGSARFHFLGAAGAGACDEPRPRVRASLNGRLVIVDDNSARQMHYLGEIRRRDGRIVFRLATAENGFAAPAADEIVDALLDYDGAQLDPDGGEEALVEAIARRLGIAAL